MHDTTPVIFTVCVLMFLLYHRHNKKVIKKIRQISSSEKYCLLDKLLAPFGLYLNCAQGILVTKVDSWQHPSDHNQLYDRSALAMEMVFHCESVYFNHKGKTWLVELWKGQYGISTGAEAGVYCASSIVPPSLRRQTIFQAPKEQDTVSVKLSLIHCGKPLFTLARTNCQLGGFALGMSTLPEDLTLEMTLSFPEESLCLAFIRALITLGYKEHEILVHNRTVQFSFTKPKAVPSVTWDSWLQSYSLWKGELFCKLYKWLTRPFSDTWDRLLYLHLLLPVACRKILRLKKTKKRIPL